MHRRVGLPGASELFRSTAADAQPVPGQPDGTASGEQPPAKARPQSSGRVKHDEKITVYVSAEELVALEQLRLSLRAEHGVAADRGRIVRAAIAEALADFSDNGAQSALLPRLTQP